MNEIEVDILIEQLRQLGKNFDDEYPVSAENIRKAAAGFADFRAALKTAELELNRLRLVNYSVLRGVK